MTTIRAATRADLPALANLWYEHAMLLSSDPRFAPAPDGPAAWETAHAARLGQPGCVLLLATDEERMLAYAAARLEPAPPGLRVRQIGVIEEMAADIHRPAPGTMSALADALAGWLRAHGADALTVRLPRLAAADQAFWRARGAGEWMQWLWLKS